MIASKILSFPISHVNILFQTKREPTASSIKQSYPETILMNKLIWSSNLKSSFDGMKLAITTQISWNSWIRLSRFPTQITNPLNYKWKIFSSLFTTRGKLWKWWNSIQDPQQKRKILKPSKRSDNWT